MGAHKNIVYAVKNRDLDYTLLTAATAVATIVPDMLHRIWTEKVPLGSLSPTNSIPHTGSRQN
jgi:hypothetical protein